jgi:integrase
MADVDKVVRDGKTAGWQARWRDPDGRQRKKTLRTKVEAEKFLAAMRTDMAHGTYIDPRAGKVTVEAWAPLYLAGLAHLKVTTRERYAGIVRLHVLPRWGRRPLASIGHAEVVGWVSELSEQGLSADSVRYVHRVFSLMLDLAVRDGRIGRNPAARVTMPRVSRREPVFLRPEDLARLVAVAGPDGPALRFLALTGLRFGEFAALRVRHVDLERRRLTVAESVSEVGGRLVWSSTKSHKTRRVPIAASLVRDLTVRCSYREADELVFTAPQGGPLRINNWRPRVFDPACERAGLTGLTPHDLRHTAASLAVSAGANVKAVQRMLGHASAAMTLDVYAGLFADDLDDVAARLDLVVPDMCPEGPSDGTPAERHRRAHGGDLR